jgi:iron(III) transport system permease protein
MPVVRRESNKERSTAFSPLRQEMVRLWKDPILLLTIAVIWLGLAIFILFPLFRLFAYTFVDNGQLSLDSLSRIWARSHNRVALTNSLWLATLVSVLGTMMGFLFAFTVARTRPPKIVTVIIDAVMTLPLISPPFTTAIALQFAAGPRGLITHGLLGISNFTLYGLWGTVVAEVLTYFPLAYLTLRAVLIAIDDRIEDAALSLGSSHWRAFWTITLPLTTPGLANSLLVLFATSLADFATPLILAGARFPVLPTQAYLQITGIYDLRGGAALSFLVLIPSLIVFLLQRYWVGQRSYVTVTGKQGGGSSMDRVPALVRLILQIISLTILGFVVFLYGIIFFGSFVEVWGANHAFTLKHFQYIFRFGRKSITDTLTIALWAMLIGGLYSVIIGYLIGKQEFFGRKTMEFVSMLNYALPGTVVGIAYLLAFNDPPIMITGTATILVALYIFRYSPAGVRTTVASLQQIDSSIEEASTSLGADRQVTFRKITLPLILPAFFASIEVVFIRAMTAISAAIFLVSFDWTLVTVRILESITELELGSASAFSVFIIVLVYLVVNAIKGLTAILGLRGIKR